jgi:hypothetical protein
MEKYKKRFEEKVKPKVDHEDGELKVNPFRDAQFALAKAAFVKQDREQFFSDAYADILTDLFVQWLKTEPHCTKEREYLYHVAMALGSVKERLVQIEQFGKNAAYIQQNEEKVDDEE